MATVIGILIFIGVGVYLVFDWTIFHGIFDRAFDKGDKNDNGSG